MRTYSVHGPFRIVKQKNGHVNKGKDSMHTFWAKVQEEDESLPSACGCYLFAIKAGKGIRPWYVGIAEKQSFESECFSLHKLNIYNEVLVGKKGTPTLFLVAKRTNGGKLAKPSRNRSRTSRFLESLLIGAAIEKNSKLMNIQKTSFLRKLSVPSLINSPKRRYSRAETAFRQAIK